jgi:aerobic carbon-monoxide dehydrogenase small subunit
VPSFSSVEQFVIASDIDRCWQFVSDLPSVAACVPGCESATPLDGKDVLLKVKLRIGYISKTLELKARVGESNPPSHFSFSATGPDAEISGIIDLLSVDKGTRLTYRIEINPVSVTGKTAMTLMGKDLVKRQAEEFAACIKSKLEKNA